MTTMTKCTLLWNLLVTVLILTEREWSLCRSMELPASHKLLKSGPVSLRRFDNNPRSVAFQRTGKAVATFNLPGACASGTGAMSCRGNRRLFPGTVETSLNKSNKEVEVLIAFKTGITRDPLGVLNSWRANDSDPCSWLGVGCRNSPKHVTTLDLSGLHLAGTVSALLGQLSSLRYLDLSKNLFSGSIPASLSNSSKLLSLNISFNQMNGDIPPLLGQLDHLQILDLSNNNFTGEIPGTLGNCSWLQYLDLGENYLEGGIPFQFGHLSKLQSLSLPGNFISGSIPSTLGNCSSLIQLSLQNNPKLGGELSLELGDLMQLQNLSIQMCNFNGSFPTFILNFTAMQYLNLGYNQFFGAIPKSLGQLSKLEVLVLGTNSLNGEIPLGISLLGHLVHIDLSSNALHGNIPTSIGNITSLQFLYLQENQLLGDIPRSIVNVTSLQHIYLDENNLTGTIPKDIGLLRNLEILYILDNGLSGPIPSSLSNCTLLQFLLLGGNPFTPQVFPSWIASITNLISLFLPNANLYGEIPKEIGQLSQLQQLSLYSNNLTGVLPASLGNCTPLGVLDVTGNALRGEIPLELGLLSGMVSLMIGSNFFSAAPFPSSVYNLTGMQQLGLWDNKFNGRLDGDFGRLQQLSEFRAYGNNFQGTISGSFINCSDLNILELGGNYLTGDIPPWLANLTTLRLISFAGNELRGVIPLDFMRNWQFLQELDLSENNFEGNIPADIGHLGSLQILDLHGNDFVGVLPVSLANCTDLLLVDLSKNRLTSSVPGELFTTTPSLTTLNLSYNLFSGSWPAQFSHLTNIEMIDVSANNFSGPIPLGLGGCFSLETLDLSSNMFSGAIPQDLGSLKYLSTFNASYNNFVGPIPDGGVFETNLTAASFLGNPGLCGAILGPQKKCPAQVPLRNGRSRCASFKCNRVWIPIVSVLGTMFLLVTVFFMRVYSHAKKQVVHEKLHMYTINPRIRLGERDILSAIAPGQDNMIGVGARSVVYQAVSPGGEIVAIKVLRDLQNQGDNQDQELKQQWEELKSEAHALGQVRHRNIIKVFTLCFSSDIKAIVLEYMPEGSLHAHLHSKDTCELTWAQRFKILLGITHGMVYLHHEISDSIIHRDLKPSNILLEGDLEPKLCDFGISRFVTTENGEATTSNLCGTLGYMAPEYGTGARVSTKGDVYSYGVVLLELLIVKEVTQVLSSGILEESFQASDFNQAFELLDATLKAEGASNANIREQMITTLRLGLLCTRGQPQNRPSMNDVLLMLMEIQQPGQGAVTESTLE